MQRDWQFPPSEDIPLELLEAVGGHNLIGRMLHRRGIIDAITANAFLNPSHYKPTEPDELPGMEQAVRRIIAALRKDQKICVWGDFDVDGQTSTTLLVQALRELGGNVSYHIPIREQEGHGVNIGALEKIILDGAELILTCDTGISAHEAVETARQKGVDIVITDHHELPDQLPFAAAIVNPRFLDRNHSLAHLPGVGVAYKVAEALFNSFGRCNEAEKFLDLVVLGIIADVALLVKENRYLAQLGMEQLRHTERLGLRKLFQMAALNPTGINEEHIGYVIGPRMNALGRLSDANKAVEFLTTNDELSTRLFAIELEGLNARRQLLTSQVYQAAISMIDRDPALLEDNVLVLGYPTWPAGIVGIVASRLAEQFGKPVILLSTPKDEIARGSARSVEGIDIIEAITTQRDLLDTFGGHQMAAGLSIAPGKIKQFKQGLSRAIARQTGGKSFYLPLTIDAEVRLEEITSEIVDAIDQLSPFGAGNPHPIFVARDLVLESNTKFGRSREHLSLTVSDSNGNIRPVLWWQGGNMDLPTGKFDLAFSVHASIYKGQPAVQMEWIEARVMAEEIHLNSSRMERELVDFRDVPDLPAQLEILRRMYPELVTWVEGEDKKFLGGKDRMELAPSPYLAIVTIPPSRLEIEQAIHKVQPEIVFFLSHNPRMDAFDKFLQRLSGLVNFGLSKYSGVLELIRLAAACAQREDVIKAGLSCLEARGLIQVTARTSTSYSLGYGDKQAKGSLEASEEHLRKCLAETKAFRKYYQHAEPDGLV